MKRALFLMVAGGLTLSLGCGGNGTEPSGSTGTTGTTSAGGTGTGGAGTGGAGTGGAGGAAPLEGPTDAWAYQAIEGTACGNGTPAGLGVNLHPDSKVLVVLLSGGGACWDDPMCNGANPTAVHIHDTLDAALVDKELPVVDRTKGALWADASWVWVPYCTGDLHWGDQDMVYPGGTIHHRGGSNLRTFLTRLKATRPGTETVYLFGGSAGGYGVTVGLEMAKEVFGASTPIHTLADASPLVPPKGTRWKDMITAWAPLFPHDCSGCTEEPGAILDTLAARYPTSRYGLLAFDQDQVISGYFGYQGDLAPAIDLMLTTHYDPHPNVHYFVAKGTGHGVPLDTSIKAPDGLTPLAFAAGWATGDASWHSVRF